MSSTSTLLCVADAVKEELNRIRFGYSVRPAVRQNVPRFKADELSSVHVTVRPKDRVSSRATRGVMQDLITVYVSLQKQCLREEDDETDDMIETGETIQVYFDQKKPLAYLPGVICEASAFGAGTESTWLSLGDINAMKVYTGLILLTFRVMRLGHA